MHLPSKRRINCNYGCPATLTALQEGEWEGGSWDENKIIGWGKRRAGREVLEEKRYLVKGRKNAVDDLLFRQWTQESE